MCKRYGDSKNEAATLWCTHCSALLMRYKLVGWFVAGAVDVSRE